MLKIIFDNNFFNHFKKLPVKTKEKIFQLVASKKISFYLTEVLLVELLPLMEIAGSKLREHFAIAATLSSGMIFNSFVSIIQGELNNDEGKSVFLSQVRESAIKNLISDIANSVSVSCERKDKILPLIRKSMEYSEGWKDVEEQHLRDVRREVRRKINSKGGITRKDIKNFLKCGFDTYYYLKSAEKIEFAYTFLKINKVTNASREKLAEVIDDSGYPYINAWVRCRFALYYHYFKNDYSQLNRNDWNDIQYLFYLPDFDYLISNDKLTGKIGEMVFSCKKVLTFDKFISLFK